MARRRTGKQVTVKKAFVGQTGKKLARMPERIRKAIGIESGDRVIVEGPKGKILRIATLAAREEIHEDIVGIDEHDRKRIGVVEGQTVVVRKPTTQDLDELEEINRSIWLFCYGSNNPSRLAQRLGRPVQGVGAYLPGYERIFRGYSRQWESGVASLRPTRQRGRAVYGYATQVSAEELEKLDIYEGVSNGAYERKTFKIIVIEDGSEKYVNAVAYVHTSGAFNLPSQAYLQAIVDTISPFWTEDGRQVTIDDIPIRRE